MKNLKIFMICLLIFLPSLACKTITGEATQVEESESVEPTVIPTLSSSLPVPEPGGIITRVTLARDSTPEKYEPVDPTTVYGPDDTIHAIVTVKKAPAGTKFTAKWLTTDVGTAAEPDFLIDTTETVQTGSGNMDFTLAPKTRFATGKYRLEMYVNDTLDQLVEFSISETE